MSVSIIERILGFPDPYTTNYIDDTLLLIRSMTMKSSDEAILYNNYVEERYRGKVLPYAPETWRYHLHLSGMYHPVDKPMIVRSRDNRENIVLTKETMFYHAETKIELNKFGEFYDEVVEQYPEQVLLLKTLMSYSPIPDVEDVVKMKDWTIVCYNSEFVEPNEIDVIDRLQQRVYNHAHKGMIMHYMQSDELFLPVMLCRLYVFMFSNILSLRTTNVKTSRVHSYYMLLYFASHHGIDMAYEYMDNYQRMKLYRNVKFYDVNAGRNDNMETLIDLLMTRKRITIVNYEFKQSNMIRDNLLTDYAYYQKLLNKENFVYEKAPFDVDALANKEIGILPKNEKEYEFNKDDIDFTMTQSLTTEISTKDLEINLIDDSNNVPYKLLDVTIDYWAASVQLGYNNSLIHFTDNVSGVGLELSASDGFKLLSIATLIAMDSRPEYIPDYYCWSILKETSPSEKEFYGKIADPYPSLLKDLEFFRVAYPKFTYMDTTRTFRSFIDRVYRFELGCWIYTGSTHDLKAKVNVDDALANIHCRVIRKQDDEKILDFLNRVGLPELYDYTPEQAQDVITTLIKFASEDIMAFFENNRLTQEAMTYVFNKFISYSTQVLSEYTSNDRIMIEGGFNRATIEHREIEKEYEISNDNSILGLDKEVTKEFEIDNERLVTFSSEKESHFDIDNGNGISNTFIKEREYIIDNGNEILEMTSEQNPPLDMSQAKVIKFISSLNKEAIYNGL